MYDVPDELHLLQDASQSIAHPTAYSCYVRAKVTRCFGSSLSYVEVTNPFWPAPCRYVMLLQYGRKGLFSIVPLARAYAFGPSYQRWIATEASRRSQSIDLRIGVDGHVRLE